MYMEITGNNEKPFCCKASLPTSGNSGGLGYSRHEPQVRSSFPCYLLATRGTVIGKIISLGFESSHSRINSIACWQKIRQSEGILQCSTTVRKCGKKVAECKRVTSECCYILLLYFFKPNTGKITQTSKLLRFMGGADRGFAFAVKR